MSRAIDGLILCIYFTTRIITTITIRNNDDIASASGCRKNARRRVVIILYYYRSIYLCLQGGERKKKSSVAVRYGLFTDNLLFRVAGELGGLRLTAGVTRVVCVPRCRAARSLPQTRCRADFRRAAPSPAVRARSLAVAHAWPRAGRTSNSGPPPPPPRKVRAEGDGIFIYLFNFFFDYRCISLRFITNLYYH